MLVLDEVREFAELARAGAYLAGDRRVSPKERTRWRVTFRRLAADAEAALRAADPAPAEEALALIIDLACEMKGYQYFRSEDPVEAARFVVSDAATLLWETVRDRHGFGAFAQRAAPQLLPVHHRACRLRTTIKNDFADPLVPAAAASPSAMLPSRQAWQIAQKNSDRDPPGQPVRPPAPRRV